MIVRTPSFRVRRSAGTLAVLLGVLALVATLLTAEVALAQSSRGTDAVCPPPGASGQDQFSDDNGSTHEPNINCLVQYGIAQGVGGDRYAPGDPTPRAQMATFIANFVEVAIADTLPAGEDRFSDDNGSTHEPNINKVANAGIVAGTGGDQYDPEVVVSRAQMATFITQAIDFVDDGQVNGSLPPAANEDFFDDDNGSTHEPNINRLAAQGIVAGVGDGNYAPGRDVSRAQMATFIMQAADYLASQSLWAPSRAVNVTLDQQQVEAGGQVTGAITGEDVASATVSGCGLQNQAVEDTDDEADGVQFSLTIPAGQQPGACQLTFTVTDSGGGDTEITKTLTIAEAEGRSTLTLSATSVPQGGQITGEIVARGQSGSESSQQRQQQDGDDVTVTSASVSGCGLGATSLTDRDSEMAGIQFSFTIPKTQPAGPCTLTFTVNFSDGESEQKTREITVEEVVSAVTEGPELQAATVGDTDEGDAEDSSDDVTTVTFTFDETVNDSVAANRFHVVSFSAQETAATSAQKSGATTVDATFPADAVEVATVATVSFRAVQDPEGNLGPEGSAALEPLSLPGGITDAPDLEETRKAGTTTWVFEFDEAAYLVGGASNYHLVLDNGAVMNGQTFVGGEGESEHEVQFAEVASARTVRRAYVDADTVSDAEQDSDPTNTEGNTNPLQAVDVASEGNTGGPDLIQVIPTSDDNTVTYVFDEAVNPNTNPLGQQAGGFNIYFPDATRQSSTDVEDGGSSQPRAVVVTFDDVNERVVGASVNADSVQAVADDETNRADELGVPTSFDGAETIAPDLQAAARQQSSDGAQVVFTFDQEAVVAEDGNPTNGNEPDFAVYNANGGRTVLTDCAQDDADSSKVICTAANSTEGDAINAAVLAAAERGAVTDSTGDYENYESSDVL